MENETRPHISSSGENIAPEITGKKWIVPGIARGIGAFRRESRCGKDIPPGISPEEGHSARNLSEERTFCQESS
jgi:hypothetical protein